MGTRIAVVLLVALAALAGCRSDPSTEPKVQVGSVRTPEPVTVSPAPQTACAVTDPLDGRRRTGKDLVTVTEDPRSLLAEWIPSRDAGPRPDPAAPFPGACQSVRTTYGRDVARRVAHEIDTAPAVRRGVYSCPNDDGSAVDLYFQLASGRWQPVWVGLSGCRRVGASGFADRSFAPPLSTDLATLAPPAWQTMNR